MDNVIMTQVFPCDPASISFSNSSSEPIISSPQTLASLQIAANDLVSLQVPVVFPTETVYGLAAPALIPSAVSQIFSIKGRPADNPLIVHVSSLEMLKSLLPPSFVMPPAYNILMSTFWPGALTLIFPTTPQIPSIITASRETVAIRMPSHPIARALIALADTPLAAPSANTSTTPSPTKAEHVFHNLSGKVRVILDGGPCNVGVESTVVDGLAADGCLRVLRPGGVTVEDMQRALAGNAGNGQPVSRILVHRRDYQDEALEDAPTTPGMKYRHYSPSVPVVLLMTSSPPGDQKPSPLPDVFSSMLSSYPADITVKIGLLTPSDSSLALLPSRLPAYAEVSLIWHMFPLGPIADPSITAQRLFDGLLTLEREGVDLIIVEGVDEGREGLAVMNRVRKAAGEIYWVNIDWLQPIESSCEPIIIT
ncbi:DHBP synthase RibB-like alpha/beta domain-containing protein [Hysterangium stoloniferum]|nr:DHBP synthase RibB-like alpha/beta domain-containing protein [Hysterangium stoloniferum]